ncbi:MAG: terminase small subunit [Oxalobacter sp.]|nr:terminase small subunit [Oxalobacter sp.]
MKDRTTAPAATGKSSRAGDALNPRQARFVSEYLVDLNGTQAAIRAGYSERSAKQTASRLLGEAAVRAAVGCAMEKRQERTELSQDEVIQDLRELRDICMGRRKVKVMTIVKNSRDGTALPVEVEGVMFEPSSANRALELLGRHMRMFTDKMDVVSNGQTLQSGVLVVPPSLDESEWEKAAASEALPLSRSNHKQQKEKQGETDE